MYVAPVVCCVLCVLRVFYVLSVPCVCNALRVMWVLCAVCVLRALCVPRVVCAVSGMCLLFLLCGRQTCFLLSPYVESLNSGLAGSVSLSVCLLMERC